MRWRSRCCRRIRTILPSPSWIGIWQDNYFALLPGESREITATSNVRDLGRAAVVVELECWNVKRRALG
jgi:hypothetical protein